MHFKDNTCYENRVVIFFCAKYVSVPDIQGKNILYQWIVNIIWDNLICGKYFVAIAYNRTLPMKD